MAKVTLSLSNTFRVFTRGCTSRGQKKTNLFVIQLSTWTKGRLIKHPARISRTWSNDDNVKIINIRFVIWYLHPFIDDRFVLFEDALFLSSSLLGQQTQVWTGEEAAVIYKRSYAPWPLSHSSFPLVIILKGIHKPSLNYILIPERDRDAFRNDRRRE